ncbi:hypothetical protein WJX84_006417 [Apatococcus fuscideae]|uniref:Uncharacterized protein n=1 Tax=Apatococcus fuscideae TaxID=2026836 RepID=A0AAW1SM54_9CHLO
MGKAKSLRDELAEKQADIEKLRALNKAFREKTRNLDILIRRCIDLQNALEGERQLKEELVQVATQAEQAASDSSEALAKLQRETQKAAEVMQAELQGAQASAEQATQAAQAAANDLREYRRDAQELSRQLHDVRRICAASQATQHTLMATAVEPQHDVSLTRIPEGVSSPEASSGFCRPAVDGNLQLAGHPHDVEQSPMNRLQQQVEQLEDGQQKLRHEVPTQALVIKATMNHNSCLSVRRVARSKLPLLTLSYQTSSATCELFVQAPLEIQDSRIKEKRSPSRQCELQQGRQAFWTAEHSQDQAQRRGFRPASCCQPHAAMGPDEGDDRGTGWRRPVDTPMASKASTDAVAAFQNIKSVQPVGYSVDTRSPGHAHTSGPGPSNGGPATESSFDEAGWQATSRLFACNWQIFCLPMLVLELWSCPALQL